MAVVGLHAATVLDSVIVDPGSQNSGSPFLRLLERVRKSREIKRDVQIPSMLTYPMKFDGWSCVCLARSGGDVVRG